MSLVIVREILEREHNRESFAKLIGRYYPTTDERFKDIMRAYGIAKEAFHDKTRESGERYFEHLRAVALILIEYMRVSDHDMIVTALLHDIVEDFPEKWFYDRLTKEFNETVSGLTWWLTKPPIDDFGSKTDRDRHYHHQLLFRAPRKALVIKLPDRLHNLLTMWDVTPEKRARKITETEDFYLPLAVREGILIHEIETALDQLKNGHVPHG